MHPNTVVYRLGRIKSLTGRDPHVPDDLLLLQLGLKLLELRSDASSAFVGFRQTAWPEFLAFPHSHSCAGHLRCAAQNRGARGGVSQQSGGDARPVVTLMARDQRSAGGTERAERERLLTPLLNDMDALAAKGLATMRAELPAYAAQSNEFFEDVLDQIRRNTTR